MVYKLELKTTLNKQWFLASYSELKMGKSFENAHDSGRVDLERHSVKGLGEALTVRVF